MTTQLELIPFRGDKIAVIWRGGTPFVSVRPICNRLGIDWKSQLNKLNAEKERWGVVMITTPSAGGEQESTCIPGQKLCAWLLGISPSKVKPEVREALIAYQNEADRVLFDHFFGKMGQLQRMAAEFQLAVPMAARIASAQRAGIDRSNLGYRFRSWSKGELYDFVQMLEDVGVIDANEWADEKRARRVEAVLSAQEAHALDKAALREGGDA